MASSAWRRHIKTALRHFGYDLTRFHPESSAAAQVAAVLRHLHTDLVLDVGANQGQYGLSLRGLGYRGRLLSFEPLSLAHRELQACASGDALWQVHPRCAIGDHAGEVTMHIAGNSVSSSVLPMLERHTAAAPESRTVGSETAPLKRLDEAASQAVAQARSPYLKIDTQGYEAPVLQGACKLLHACHAVQLELSLVPLYEGQELWDYFVPFMAERGFVLWSVLPGFVDASSGRTLQVDAIFVRSGATPAA